MKATSIIKPQPIENFNKKRTIFIPFDPNKGIIKKLVQAQAIKSQLLYQSKVYLLKDKIILLEAMGAPAAVLALERLIASGSKEIIVLSFCGSLNPEIPIGSVVLINKAYSNEGTSKHYFPEKKVFQSSKKLYLEIENILKNHSLSYFKSSIVSTDAPFRETFFWAKKMQQKGIDCVDMEISAVYALAKFYHIEAASLMIVSDELTKDKWISSFSQLDEKIKEYFFIFI
ncbi:MAG: nucleoside phosphorylase [Candidatus Aminicenantia bacterium]